MLLELGGKGTFIHCWKKCKLVQPILRYLRISITNLEDGGWQNGNEKESVRERGSEREFCGHIWSVSEGQVDSEGHSRLADPALFDEEPVLLLQALLGGWH